MGHLKAAEALAVLLLHRLVVGINDCTAAHISDTPIRLTTTSQFLGDSDKIRAACVPHHALNVGTPQVQNKRPPSAKRIM